MFISSPSMTAFLISASSGISPVLLDEAVDQGRFPNLQEMKG
jgi:hypothetical protein